MRRGTFCARRPDASSARWASNDPPAVASFRSSRPICSPAFPRFTSAGDCCAWEVPAAGVRRSVMAMPVTRLRGRRRTGDDMVRRNVSRGEVERPVPGAGAARRDRGPGQPLRTSITSRGGPESVVTSNGARELRADRPGEHRLEVAGSGELDDRRRVGREARRTGVGGGRLGLGEVDARGVLHPDLEHAAPLRLTSLPDPSSVTGRST